MQERWSYTLRSYAEPHAERLFYEVDDEKDLVQDQLVNRAERGYWRPLTQPLPTEVASRDWRISNFKIVAAGGGSGAGAQAEEPGGAVKDALASTPGRDAKRKAAQKAMEEQALKMQKKAAEKQGQGELTVGMVVQLRKEDVDRAKLDNPSATLVVLARTDADNYTVGNTAGVYKEYVSRSYLTPVPNATAALVGLEQILADYLDPAKNKKLKRVSIRLIAAADSAAGK